MYFKEINILARKSVKIKSNPNKTKKNDLKKKKASHLKISLKIHVLPGPRDNSFDYYLHLTNGDN